jgi:hypothetical protein
MKSLAYALDIDAPPQRIWEQLTDFAGFTEWNPFIRRAAGRLEPGQRIEIRMKLGASERTFRPILSRVEPNRELRWLARIGPKGVFDVERIFELQPLSTGGTRFVQSETCTGVLAPLLFLGGKLERDILRGYREFADAIKRRVEPAVGVR